MKQFRSGLEQSFENLDNPELLRGHARLDGREGKFFRVRVGDSSVTASQVVLDTGTRTLIPLVEGLDKVNFLHAGNWLDRPELPDQLAVIGGGYIGLEMAQFYERMGSRVTVIEESNQTAGHEDEDVAREIQKLLESEAIRFRLDTRVVHVETLSRSLVLTLQTGNALETLQASHLFVATGRMPNTDDLGLESVGLKISQKGIIETNERLATSVEGIWVAGDIRGGPMFTHTSWDDYRILMSQLAGDGSRTTKRVVPYAIFTDPELGRAGLTESEARQAGTAIKVARFEMVRNGKAKELSETGGFIKVVVDHETDRILGATVLSAEGAELIHLYVDIMNAGAPYTVIRDAIHIHPTLAEAVQSAVAALD